MSSSNAPDDPGKGKNLPRSDDCRPRVLLVDDDERNLLALSEILSPIAEIVTASSGKKALRELLKDEFAVILLDVFMPEMDGYETAALIRQRPQAARTPIIFLSAVNKETEHLLRGYSMGAVDYVFKPVDPIILKSKVTVFVDLFELRRQVASQAAAEQELREARLRAENDRLAYERELQEAQLRQAAILEALPLALYEASFDAKGRLFRHFVGGDVEKIVGPDAEALTAGTLRWCDRIAGADGTALERRLANSKEASVTSHYRWSRSDGTEIHVIDQCVRSSASANGWVGTLIDVTGQRELEQQLVQSRKAEALGQLTGGIAHDFNNLLAVLLGGLRLLEKRIKPDGREKQIFEHMNHAAENGAELVRRLMAFARKQELSPTMIDLTELSNSVAGLVEHTLGGMVEVEWQVPELTLQLYADKAQLELSLVNLLINARDAMPKGGKVTVAIEAVGNAEADHLPDATGGHLRIRVSDEGSGIPLELIERVTEPFFTTKAPGIGTGLGLSMVAGFVQQSGGTFKIASELGRGTRIDLVFPACAAGAEASQPEPSNDTQPALVASVLVVDDDASVRLVLSEQLRDLGLNVTVAESAEHALSMLEGHAADLEFVLTDYSMPGMDGLNLLTVVGRKWPKIRGAIMTGNLQEEVDRRGTRLPIIRKPVDVRELRQLLTVC